MDTQWIHNASTVTITPTITQTIYWNFRIWRNINCTPGLAICYVRECALVVCIFFIYERKHTDISFFRLAFCIVKLGNISYGFTPRHFEHVVKNILFLYLNYLSCDNDNQLHLHSPCLVEQPAIHTLSRNTNLQEKNNNTVQQ